MESVCGWPLTSAKAKIPHSTTRLSAEVTVICAKTFQVRWNQKKSSASFCFNRIGLAGRVTYDRLGTQQVANTSNSCILQEEQERCLLPTVERTNAQIYINLQNNSLQRHQRSNTKPGSKLSLDLNGQSCAKLPSQKMELHLLGQSKMLSKKRLQQREWRRSVESHNTADLLALAPGKCIWPKREHV